MGFDPCFTKTTRITNELLNVPGLQSLPPISGSLYKFFKTMNFELWTFIDLTLILTLYNHKKQTKAKKKFFWLKKSNHFSNQLKATKIKTKEP